MFRNKVRFPTAELWNNSVYAASNYEHTTNDSKRDPTYFGKIMQPLILYVTLRIETTNTNFILF